MSIIYAGQNRKNKIINGNFDIWQRGTSQTSSGYGSNDRWSDVNSGSTKTHSQQSFAIGQTDVPGEPQYFSRTVVTSSAGAANYAAKIQKIESVRTIAGKTATLSFYAKADASRDIATEFVQNFGTGGSPSSQITGIGSTTFSLTTSWQKFEVTVSLPSISGKTLGTDNNDYIYVRFWFDAGSDYNSRTNSLGQQSGTFDIAQVQLEEGSTVTSFDSRHIGEELALCQRYYQANVSLTLLTTDGISLSEVYRNINLFSTTMRAEPTMTCTSVSESGTGWNGILTTDISFSVIKPNGFRWQATGKVADPDSMNTIYIDWTADAEL